MFPEKNGRSRWPFAFVVILLFVVTSGTSNAQGFDCAAQFKAAHPAVFDSGQVRQGVWMRDASSDTVFVLVHGIFSDNKDAWLNTTVDGQCAYWPDIIKADPTFDRTGIFLASYFTSPSSRGYDIKSAADDLFNLLRTPQSNDIFAPLHFPRLVFIAHSAGGLVVKRMITKYQWAFKDRDVAVLLVASPARGSGWADRAQTISSLFKNSMALELRSSDPILNVIHADFLNYVRDGAHKAVRGLELFEDTFFRLQCGWLPDILCSTVVPVALDPVVREIDGGGYFGEGEVIGGTDHSSIIKPTNERARGHTRLRNFYWNDVRKGVPLQRHDDFPGYIELEGATSTLGWKNANMDTYELNLIAITCPIVLEGKDPCVKKLEDVQAHNPPRIGDRRWIAVSGADYSNNLGDPGKFEFIEDLTSLESGEGFTHVAIRVVERDRQAIAVRTYSRKFRLQEFGEVDKKPWKVKQPVCRSLHCPVRVDVPKEVALSKLSENYVIGDASSDWSLLLGGTKLSASGVLSLDDISESDGTVHLTFNVQSPRIGQ